MLSKTWTALALKSETHGFLPYHITPTFVTVKSIFYLSKAQYSQILPSVPHCPYVSSPHWTLLFPLRKSYFNASWTMSSNQLPLPQCVTLHNFPLISWISVIRDVDLFSRMMTKVRRPIFWRVKRRWCLPDFVRPNLSATLHQHSASCHSRLARSVFLDEPSCSGCSSPYRTRSSYTSWSADV